MHRRNSLLLSGDLKEESFTLGSTRVNLDWKLYDYQLNKVSDVSDDTPRNQMIAIADRTGEIFVKRQYEKMKKIRKRLRIGTYTLFH